MSVLAKITAYKNFLVLDLLAQRSIEGQCHISADNPTVIGQVIMNTHTNLGVSKQALELLKKVKKGPGSLGDVDWFKSGDAHVFGWIGGPKAIKHVTDIETSRQFVIGSYVEIENDVPELAAQAIDEIATEDQEWPFG